jgi:hypothetical protein
VPKAKKPTYVRRKTWLETGRPNRKEVRGWRSAHVSAVVRHLNDALERCRRLKALLDDSTRPGRAPLKEEEAPARAYDLAIERAALLEREIALLYALVEARSLGVIRNGRLVIGAGNLNPPKLVALESVRATRASIEKRIARMEVRRRQPARSGLDPSTLVPGRPAKQVPPASPGKD